ncbi:hypothetical protein CHS0354_001034 [Potamilus streckersoni]|uniref:Uncharacterized protein n=1 Tax=Potamilus streckersoni TaxID=2493646 RepID=A0AAE0SUY0_9BIVA|nr:hypothetical protein CHS0354_001034 [Potamilus streckersoni]
MYDTRSRCNRGGHVAGVIAVSPLQCTYACNGHVKGLVTSFSCKTPLRLMMLRTMFGISHMQTLH